MDVVLCPSCGEENPAKFRLCGYCGTPLAQGAADAPAAPVAAAPPVEARLPPREIRKTVTLLFTDLKDSTALTGRIDAEAMNEIKARYFSAMAAEIRSHGGEVEKNVGDAIMAVFGRIRAREDDALRAVRAAHSMQSKVAELNEDFQRYYGVEISVRTGVNTGEIVANLDPTADQNLATGDAVNVAARLEQNAPAGEVLLGGVTHELVQHHVEVERLELALKGKPEPVPAYRLIDVHDTAAPIHADTPLLGRDTEVRRLRETFEATAAERSPRLVTVTGEAGVGKSRLIADFVEGASGEVEVLRGRCLAYGDGITFWPLVEIVRSAAEIAEDDTPDQARARITDLLPDDDPDRERIVDRLVSAIGLSTRDFPVTEIFWGARRLLESRAATRPLVVVVDDIHDAEATFLDLLTHLVESPSPHPILLLCSARPEVSTAHPEWWEATGRTRIELAPLGADAVEAIIDQLLGHASLSPEVRQRVVTAAEGNPLYVEQLVSMLRDRRIDDGSDVVVPPTIAALLSARLDALSEPERAVIEPASVIGVQFPSPAVHELVPDPVRPSVSTHLESLRGKQFIQPTTLSGEDDAYRFHHVLVRDATYQSLLKRARATLHEQFVAWAERVNAERGRGTEFEEILGYHLEQAVRYRSELGPLDEHGRELAKRAAAKLSSAGMRALDRSDMPAAANLLGRAVDLLEPSDPTRLELVPELGEALMALSRFEDAGTLLGSSLDTARGVGDRRLEGLIRLRQLTLELMGGSTDEAAALAEAETVLSTLVELGDHGGAARAWRVLSLIHANAGHYDHIADAAQHLIEEGTASGEERLVRQGATGYAVAAVLGTTPVTEALAVCERILHDVEGDRRAEAIVCGAVAQLRAMQGDFDEARQMYRQEMSLLDDLGTSRESASTSIESARVEVLAGDLEAAEAHLRRDDALLAELGERYFRSTVAGLLGRVLLLRGAYDDAEAFVVLAEALSESDDAWSQVLWRSARARLLAASDPDRALELAQGAVDFAETTADLELRGDAWSDFGEVHAEIGNGDDAIKALHQALGLYQRKGDTTSAARTGRRLDELSRAAD
ncbi:MAG TPA: AAA family ATPase [Nocardioides sp.]|nr:AAA family ATPase [Nocardioides sp.]